MSEQRVSARRSAGTGRRRVLVVARGWGVGATGGALVVAGTVLDYPGVTGLGLALLALLAVSLAGVLLPAPLRVDRSVEPARVTRLGSATGVLEIRNAARWPLRVEATDRVAGVELPVDVPTLGGRTSTRAEFAVPATSRGRVLTGPVRIRRRGLADLVAARSEHGEPVAVTVLPRVLPCRGMPAGVRRGHAGADEKVLQGGTDLVGLREYVPGDDLRRLHAATSARTGRLMIREDADPGRPHLTVLLDDRPRSYAGPPPLTADGVVDAADVPGGPEGFEEAADVAASLVAAATRAGHPTRLVTASGVADVDLDAVAPGASSSAGLELVRQALADLGEPAADGDLTGGRARVARHEPDVLAVVSGVHADQAVLRQVARSGHVGAVLVVDPSPDRPVSAAGGVVVLAGPRAEDLLRGWDLAVVR